MSDRPHKKLLVWKKSIDLAGDIYRLTGRLPKSEEFGLTAQLKRAVISVSSNIAEGCARQSNKEKIQFFFISRGSLSEIDTQLELIRKLSFIEDNEFFSISSRVDEVNRLLNGLIEAQRRKA